MNGMVRPVSGMMRVIPPTTTKSWNAMTNARPPASSLPKPSRTPTAVPQAALDEHQVDQQEREQPGEAELLAERREMKSE